MKIRGQETFMNTLIPLLGSKKKANTLLKTYLNLTDTASATDIGLFIQSLESELLALEEAALNADSPEAQAEIINRAVRLALVKCSIRGWFHRLCHIGDICGLSFEKKASSGRN